MYGYEAIITYFENLAINNAHFLHTQAGRISFISTDIEQFLAHQSNSKILFPLLIAGFQPTGIDRGSGKFILSDTAPTEREYNFNLAIISEVENMNMHLASKNTLIELDIIADAIVAQVEEDRLNNLDTPDCCFLKYIDKTIYTYKTHTIGTRKALGLVLNFTFKFCR